MTFDHMQFQIDHPTRTLQGTMRWLYCEAYKAGVYQDIERYGDLLRAQTIITDALAAGLEAHNFAALERITRAQQQTSITAKTGSSINARALGDESV